MSLLNLDSIGKETRRKIRTEVGVRNVNELIQMAQEQGMDLGVRRSTQKKRAYEYFGMLYNESIEAQNKIKEDEKKARKAARRAERLARKRAKEEKLKKVDKYILHMKLKIECKKVIIQKNSDNRREPKIDIFEVNRELNFKTTYPEYYYRKQIQKVNRILKPLYDAFTLENRVFSFELKGISKKLKGTIHDLFKDSGVDACWIKSYELIPLPIGTPENILINPIRDAGAMDLDGMIRNEVWCKNTGTCVPDWLTYKYEDMRGHKKSVKDYGIIEHLSTHENGKKIYHNEPNKNGYTIQNITLFCKNTKKTLIIAHNGKVILYIQAERCDNPLAIEIKNNHLYPITDSSKVRSIVQIGKSTSFHIHEEKERPVYKNIEYIDSNYDPKKFILDKMYELNMQTYNQKIIVSNHQLQNFHIGNTLYSTTPYNEDVKTFCELKGIPYQGQNILSFLPEYMDKLPSTFMNDEIANALLRDGVKHRTHYGKFNEGDINANSDVNGEIISGDINKCYRHIMENPMDNFMTFDFTSQIECSKFHNEFGLYYVTTDDMSILHGSNWYSNKILQMAVNHHIPFDAKYFIKGIRQNKNILKKIIDEIKDVFSKPLTKLLINSISGMLGKTHSKSYVLQVDNDINRVWESIPTNIDDFFIEQKVMKHNTEKRQGIRTESTPSKEEKILYLYGQKSKKTLLKNNLPMYIQILDWSNMLLAKYILELGGYEHLLYRKTDAFIMRNIGIKPNFTDEIGGYSQNSIPIFLKETSVRHVDYIYEPTTWNTIDIKNSDDYEKINKHLQNNSLMICAKPGTGKSFIIQKIDKMNKCVKLAFTNKAASNIGGETIHRFLGLDEENKFTLQNVLNKLKKVNIIIVDEISMIDKVLWKILYEIKYMTQINFLLCGDYRQLPPVKDETDYFNHSSVRFITDDFRCDLQYFEKCRFDKELNDYLDDVWNEKPLNIDLHPMKEGAHICFTNKKRKEINTLLNKKGKLIPYLGPVNKYNEDIRIAVGVPLVGLVANKKLDIVKNEVYTITKIDEHIHFGEHYIDRQDIHKYFMLGYAMTIHKAQGQTIDGILNIHEIKDIIHNKRMFYTAISRATSLKNINYVNS
jgi:hypothetical protein